jgi:hypothetical protein
MKNRIPHLLAAVLALSGWSLASSALAQSTPQNPETAPPHPLADPYVPPAKRVPAQQAPASGAALHAQALHKLQRQFDAATPPNSTTLTKDQARAAGLGYIADHFDQIDRHGSGKVSFEDVKHYMKQRGANIP